MNSSDGQPRAHFCCCAVMLHSPPQELGWTMFLMIVKGYVPRLSLGVTNDLLPLMQVLGAVDSGITFSSEALRCIINMEEDRDNAR